MKLLSGLVSEISSVVDTLAVSSKEKKQIEADLVAAIARQEEALSQSQSSIIQAEAQGNWLQRSWRPIIMLVFATIVLIGTFFDLPILSDTSRFWDLLEIGIGGYVIGRNICAVPNAAVCWKPSTPLCCTLPMGPMPCRRPITWRVTTLRYPPIWWWPAVGG